MSKFIFKICSKREWFNFQKKQNFFGTKKDIEDGYIHLSKKNQIKKTLKKHFFKIDKLILLKIDTSKLNNLKWEKSQEGLIFPHLYSHLNLNDIKGTYKVKLLKNGYHYLDNF
jgi:uncharacterized protein (DUF952 family)